MSKHCDGIGESAAAFSVCIRYLNPEQPVNDPFVTYVYIVFMSHMPVCRLFVIIAREAPVAVIFRQGPKDHTRLIKWRLDTGTFEYGQWLTAKVYERRSDLSPSGEYLICGISRKKPSYMPGMSEWTTISKIPYFSALVLWPKTKSAGGGIWNSDLSVMLNHVENEKMLADGFKLRIGLKLNLCAEDMAKGSDFPIYEHLLERDNWVKTEDISYKKTERRIQPDLNRNALRVYEKSSPGGFRLAKVVSFLTANNSVFTQYDHVLLKASGEILFRLESDDWADWQGDDLLFSSQGQLFSLAGADLDKGVAAARCIADFTNMTFEPLKAPPGATHWSYAKNRG